MNLTHCQTRHPSYKSQDKLQPVSSRGEFQTRPYIWMPGRANYRQLAQSSLPVFRDELERDAVVAPAFARGRWSVVKDVPMVPAAARAMVFSAR